ncbi:MAG: acetyl-CoA C-acetyltransferase, partial [Planctomycetaceae bacterium]|nr:acetyl-CoA C-acetyltransferase [Planctomycetaceae bacterium]
ASLLRTTVSLLVTLLGSRTMEMRDVVIAGYLRTAQSRSRPQEPARDWFGKMRSDDLLALLLPALLERTGVAPDDVDDFIVGCAQAVSEQFTIGGRGPLILANLSRRTSAKCIDQQCGSAIAAMQMGFMEIAMGYADTVLCGGMEHMTRVPMGGDGAVDLNLRFFMDPKLGRWDMVNSMNMGMTAEKLADVGNIGRQAMDEWGVRSHQRAFAAQEAGYFRDEILPVEAPQADGSTLVVDTDQAVRGDTSLEGMAGLRTPFRKEGRITPGNASPLNAGAVSLLLMSKEQAAARGIRPLATIRSIGFAGVEPNLMGAGPVPSSLRALESAGLAAADIDFWEINEAFSVVVLYAIQELGIDPAKVNVKGGGIAIGHPLGASGGRLVGTLARILEQENGRFGCATMCCGGGQGVAMIIERENYEG